MAGSHFDQRRIGVNIFKTGRVTCVAMGVFIFMVLLAVSSGASPSCIERTLKVAVDIGHSNTDPGAISATGKHEYQFNLRFANELVALAAGNSTLDLFLINPFGSKIKLRERTKLAATQSADVFISIHHDSVNERYLKNGDQEGRRQAFTNSFRGYSLFVSSKNSLFEESKKLAKSIGRHFKAADLYATLHHAEPIKGEGRKLLDWELGLYDAPFAVLSSSTMPAVLLELGIITNRDEEKMLEAPEYRNILGLAILKALQSYCQSGPK